ncbi:Crp/Fnr family transcriptional regulator [Methylobacterium sp. J-043]|uniref:Crp/Fnr family transcriptional regulator n=1 Tax=Methylorubrum TaxID=2282523 RepID=UPI0020A03601|nr:Crp/Fnr family transcriptional regulator [Methylobacterium sp. J-043]MCP1548649.1 CRP-like cAMP-binding protein [Methylorubrum zatmanii]MCP1554737.1 CRP-like cAMP-binding protein [Methylorubrum extorquens]MCP1578952.1 CRP-like cAMP-binding protein [Methylorubrum extorquens]
MANLLVRKLENFIRLTSEEKQALEKIAQPTRRLGPREDVVRDGDRPRHVNVVLEGWACRYKQLEDGRRQVISIFLPGDLCDPHVFVLRKMDHSLGTLTSVVLAEISEAAIREISVQFPRVAEALWWEMLVTSAIQREWTVSLGQRLATERLGHLFCELFLRLRAVGMTSDTSCEFPITQADLGDAMGLSTVHINRTLKELRAEGLIRLRGRQLTIPDFPALQAASLFDPSYLHHERDSSVMDED